MTEQIQLSDLLDLAEIHTRLVLVELKQSYAAAVLGDSRSPETLTDRVYTLAKLGVEILDFPSGGQPQPLNLAVNANRRRLASKHLGTMSITS
jgi:hypothetical protein